MLLDEEEFEGVTARQNRTRVIDKLIERPLGMAYRMGIEAIGERLVEVCASDAKSPEELIGRVMDVAERVSDGDAVKVALLIRTMCRWFVPAHMAFGSIGGSAVSGRGAKRICEGLIEEGE